MVGQSSHSDTTDAGGRPDSDRSTPQTLVGMDKLPADVRSRLLAEWPAELAAIYARNRAEQDRWKREKQAAVDAQQMPPPPQRPPPQQPSATMAVPPPVPIVIVNAMKKKRSASEAMEAATRLTRMKCKRIEAAEQHPAEHGRFSIQLGVDAAQPIDAWVVSFNPKTQFAVAVFGKDKAVALPLGIVTDGCKETLQKRHKAIQKAERAVAKRRPNLYPLHVATDFRSTPDGELQIISGRQATATKTLSGAFS